MSTLSQMEKEKRFSAEAETKAMNKKARETVECKAKEMVDEATQLA